MTRISQTILFLSSAAFCIIALLGAAIYGFGLDNAATRAFNRAFPVLPAAMVNGRFIMFGQVDARQEMYDHALRLTSVAVNQNINQTRGQILFELMREEVLRKEIKKSSTQAFPSLADYASFKLESFELEPRLGLGVDRAEFIASIIRPDWERQVVQAMLASEKLDTPSYRRIQSAERELADGKSWVEVVKKFSEDEKSKYIGGDLGAWELSAINPWYRESVAALAASSTSRVMTTPEGYRIFRAARRDVGPPEKIHLQHILVSGADVEQYIDKLVKTSRIYTFGRQR